MIGQCYSADGRKYNVIILAGGAGSRMGDISDHVPKALAPLGNNRAIDHIIQQHLPVAGKFIIGTGWHADLLEAYVRGRYNGVPIEFSRETPNEMRNNAHSTMLCLDHADSRLPTVITFCDLIIGGTSSLIGDAIFIATHNTAGNIGTFRHVTHSGRIILCDDPVKMADGVGGVLGYFSFSNTVLLKSCAYVDAPSAMDLTDDIVKPYYAGVELPISECGFVYEFGTENDIQAVRKLWEAS